MMKKTLTIALLIAMIIGSCKESTRKEGAEKKNIETIENVSDGITKATSINQDGKKLEFLFNNMAGTATLNFNNETIELISQKPASGIWYKNEQYELRGKGNDITLKKDGKI